jgi:hypothetical protein
VLKPAWEDKSMDQLHVSIENKSKLRKLKIKEDEAVIAGKSYIILRTLYIGSEYEKRLES